MKDTGFGEHFGYNKSHGNAYTCVQHTVERVGHIGINWSIVQYNTEHNSAGLYGAGPVEYLTEQNKQQNSDKEEGQHDCRAVSVGVNEQIEPEQNNAQKSAYNCAYKTVAAVEFGVVKCAAHTKNNAYAGKGWVAVDEQINQRAKQAGECSLEAAYSDGSIKTELVILFHIGDPSCCFSNTRLYHYDIIN